MFVTTYGMCNRRAGGIMCAGNVTSQPTSSSLAQLLGFFDAIGQNGRRRVVRLLEAINDCRTLYPATGTLQAVFFEAYTDHHVHRRCQGLHLQPAGLREYKGRPQKRHRLSTDQLAVTPRPADSKPVRVKTGDARSTLSLRADENDPRAGFQQLNCVETKVCVHPLSAVHAHSLYQTELQAMKCVLQQELNFVKRELQLIRTANKQAEVEKAMLDREVTTEPTALLHVSHHDLQA